MAPNDELKAYATSAFDFYELLSLSSNFSQKELDRARRLTSFKYHPDKVGDDASAREKLHLTNIGYELLNDPQLRALYDNTRSARERKKASEAHLEAGRRKLKEDLEARELAGRRATDGFGISATRLSESEQKLRWLAEEGKRRRLVLQAKRERELEQESDKEQASYATGQQPTTAASAAAEDDVPELDRSVKITFPRMANVPQPTTTLLTSMMQTFGAVDSAFLVKSKRAKASDGTGIIMTGTAYVVFLKQAGAVAALRKWQSYRTDANAGGEFWSTVDGMSWAGGEEPEGLRDLEAVPGPSTPKEEMLGINPRQAPARNPFAVGPNGQLSLEDEAMNCLRNASYQVSQAA